MKRFCRMGIAWTVLGVFATFLAEPALSQTSSPGYLVAPGSTRDGWQERVIRRASSAPVVQGEPIRMNQPHTTRSAAPRNFTMQPHTSLVSEDLPPEIIASGPGEPMDAGDMAFDINPPLIDGSFDGYVEDPIGCQSCGPAGCGVTGYGDCGGCGTCVQCGYGYYSGAVVYRALDYVIRHTTLHLGVHGFKNGPDLGRNGSFGFQAGVNMAGPLGGPWGFGYQVGYANVRSNLSGNWLQTSAFGSDEDRGQSFITAGVFRRAQCAGLQGGVVYDLLSDTYYDDYDLAQIRAELSIVNPAGRELGFWGAFKTRSSEFMNLTAQTHWEVAPVNLYAFFYRKRFQIGGDGRGWLGFTGDGNFVVGGDTTIPLNPGLALQGNFNYVVPKEDGTIGQIEEGWNLTMQLVWYPGGGAQCAASNPFAPLFEVADNTWMTTGIR